MTRTTRAWQAPAREVLAAVTQTLDQPFGQSAIFGPMSRYDAYSFRQRIYSWRRGVIDNCSNPARPDFEANARWLAGLHPRANIDWIEQTIFSIEERPTPTGSEWYVLGRVRARLAGGPLHDPLATPFTTPSKNPPVLTNIEVVRLAQSLNLPDTLPLERRMIDLSSSGFTRDQVLVMLSEEFA